VLGANDGIISTSSLITGIAAAGATHDTVILTGVAGLVAGAMSMAAGEFVSVSSQSDTEKADLELEKKSLEDNFEFEKEELALLYEKRGLEPELAVEVAEQLMSHDALGAHARDELGIFDHSSARPVQAALFSAVAFAIGALLPLMVVLGSPPEQLIFTEIAASLLFLVLLGAVAARIGGAPIVTGAIRVCFWGALAMLLTVAVGRLFDVAV
jgi:VIT1/CCC1 family predicted Fe2+/Mn2+ transporter